MALFGKKPAQPQPFGLPDNLRADLRRVLEAAPDSACNGRLREAKYLAPLLALSEGLPSDEEVQGLTLCMEPWKGAGYMVLTDRRLIFALKPTKENNMNDGPVEMIAVPFSDVKQFVFDSGMAAVTFGDKQLNLGLIQGGPHSRDVCGQVKTAIDTRGPYRL